MGWVHPISMMTLQDWEEVNKQKRASLAIIVNDETDEILAVCRRGTDNDWGLPGGKPEPFETDYDAMVREVYEETGYRVNHAFLFDVSHRGERIISTFVVTWHDPIPDKPIEDLVVGWKTLDEISTNDCQYAEFNYERLDRYFSLRTKKKES
jgi:8-oxo-dGTP pyrophosphatase MutT (NUDIX family)